MIYDCLLESLVIGLREGLPDHTVAIDTRPMTASYPPDESSIHITNWDDSSDGSINNTHNNYISYIRLEFRFDGEIFKLCTCNGVLGFSAPIADEQCIPKMVKHILAYF